MGIDAKKLGGPILGIDLGMTSVIAAYVPGPSEPPRIIPTGNGQSSLAAIVGFSAEDSDQAPILGRLAHDRLTTFPALTITGIKRMLGRKITSLAVQELKARAGFAIEEDAEGLACALINGRQIRMPEAAGILLSQMRTFAEQHLGEPVLQAVIAVPAYFNDAQKGAVIEAGALAGLHVGKLVHEPTAVALAYGYNKGEDARIVIVDMGGVRLDVSVMEISGNVFEVVATGGDPYLGGADLDALITEWILTQIQKKYAVDLRQEARLLKRVRAAAEQAKCELTKYKAVDLHIPLQVGQGDRPVGVLRLHASIVEDLGHELSQRVLETIKRTLLARSLKVADIDDVILVGGATRMPLLRRQIEHYFSKPAVTHLPPEEVVACGAALLADSLKREFQELQNLAPEGIGIALADGRYMRIIDKDSKLPITRRVTVPTVRDNQRILELDLFEGDAEDIIEVDYLGTVVYAHIPEAKAGEQKVVIDMIFGADRTLLLSSPEPGRENETFEFITKGHKSRPSQVSARFFVAKGRPSAAPP